MLSHLDDYVVGRFARTLGFALVSFVTLYVVIDLIDHLDDFFVRDVAPADIGSYYLNYIPYIVVFTMPIGMLLSTIFVVGSMGSDNELVAIKAAGISAYRVAWPLLRTGLLVSVVALLLAEVVVPAANDARSRILEIGPRRSRSGQLRHVCRQDRGGVLLYAGVYGRTSERAVQVTVVQVKDDRPTRRIDAAEMRWDEQGWLLRDVTDRRFVGDGEVLTNRKTMRLPLLTLVPADLGRADKLPDRMAFLELADHIRRVRQAGGDASRWLVDLHLKIAFPLANLVLVWLGFPIAARSWRGGKALYVGLTLLIGFVFFVVVRAGQALGRSGEIDPLIGAWGANIAFFAVGLGLFWYSRK